MPLKNVFKQDQTANVFIMPVYQIQDRRRKSDRIVQALGDTSGYGRLKVKTSQSKFVEQFVEYSPLSGNHDLILGVHRNG